MPMSWRPVIPSTVLVITNDHDEHADAVIEELDRRAVPVFRFHPEEFTNASSISMEICNGRIDGEIRNADQRVAFHDICAAWYRRSRALFAPLPSLNLLYGDLENFVRVQSSATLSGLFAGLETLWVGQPSKLRQAEVKAVQLAEAGKAGLATPRTLISNDPERATAFVEALGDADCAIKPLIATRVDGEEGARLPLTTILPRGHALDSLALSPNVFQPYVEKAYELFDLPERVQAGLHRLMHSFEINFASIDMIVTPDGEFVFLDLNPNGQWLWLEEELGLPLVAGMADLLTREYSPAREAVSPVLVPDIEPAHGA